MARNHKINKVSDEEKIDIINNSVQNAKNQIVGSASETKKMFVRPIVNTDGSASLADVIDRVVEETESALDELDGNITRVVKDGNHVETLNVDELAMRSETDALKQTVNTAFQVAEGATKAVAFENYAALVMQLLAHVGSSIYRVGQNFYIKTKGVPDLWVYGIEKEYADYKYVSDELIASAVRGVGTIQIGYYVVSSLESEGAVVGEGVQYETDVRLNTKDKTIVGAINELRTLIPDNTIILADFALIDRNDKVLFDEISNRVITDGAILYGKLDSVIFPVSIFTDENRGVVWSATVNFFATIGLSTLELFINEAGNFDMIIKPYADKEYVDGLVGDIDTALDELHNYAQNLINGGASE
jgi:hypothetical protein